MNIKKKKKTHKVFHIDKLIKIHRFYLLRIRSPIFITIKNSILHSITTLNGSTIDLGPEMYSKIVEDCEKVEICVLCREP
jgi:hypothetical protein